LGRRENPSPKVGKFMHNAMQAAFFAHDSLICQVFPDQSSILIRSIDLRSHSNPCQYLNHALFDLFLTYSITQE
jgi:hypothetical protein